MVEDITPKAKSLLGADRLSLGERQEYVIWLDAKPYKLKLKDDHDILFVVDARLYSSSVQRNAWVIESLVKDNIDLTKISFNIDGTDRSFSLSESEDTYSNRLFPLPESPPSPDPIFTFSRYEIEKKVGIMELPAWADYSLAIKGKDGWKVIYIDVDQL